MPRPQRNADAQRRAELARIHIQADQLGLSREQYEDVLWAVARVESSKDLDSHGRQAVIKHLQAHLERAGKATGPQGRPPRTLAQRPQLRKIGALLADARRSWDYAEAMAARMCGKDALEFCDDADLSKIIAALAIDQRRKAQPRA
jgi:phage gp16-like protein